MGARPALALEPSHKEKMMSAHIWSVPLVLFCVLVGTALAQSPRSVVIPIPDVDKWKVELFCGAVDGGAVNGPRLGSGGPGMVVFDEYGNAYVAHDTYISVIVDDAVHLLAGLPGVPGGADGPIDRAAFRSIGSIALGPDGAIYVGDSGNHCIKKVSRDKDGRWTVATVAGVPGRSGYKDGPAGEALFSRPDGLAFDNAGNLYVLDEDRLRKVSGGQVTTLNAPRGSGFRDGPLAEARFNRIMGGSNGMASDGENLYVADRWNNIFRKVDLKAGTVSTIAGGAARGQPGFVSGGHTIDGPAMEAHFHSGGGPCSIVRCPVTGAFYTHTADENYARVIHEGQVWTFGPLKGGREAKLIGPMNEVTGSGTGVAGVDRQGRVYVGEGGLVRRFYREPPFPGAEPSKEPNPLAGLYQYADPPNSVLLKASGTKLDIPTADGAALVAGAAIIPVPDDRAQLYPAVASGARGTLLAWQQGGTTLGEAPAIALCFIDKVGKLTEALEYPGESPAVACNPKTGDFLVAWQARRAKGPNYDIMTRLVRPGEARQAAHLIADGPANQIRPAVASDGNGFLVVWNELLEAAANGPLYVIRARLLDATGKPRTEILDIEPRGGNIAATFDGRDYVVAFERSAQVYVWRISTAGATVGERIKPGGVFAHRPAVAGNGQLAVVTGSCRPMPNPWGWNGPSAFSIGRVTRDGKTPERFGFDYHQLADGGFAGLLDRAQWKGHKGWPAGRPGGFHTTENGYWPHLYSAAAWDGKTWVAVWVRAKLDGMSLVDHDVFACRIDPETMMPTSEPVLVAGGNAEPGSQSVPALTGLGDGKSLLAYQLVGEDGRSQVAIRVLGGGPLRGPARVEVKSK